MLTEKEIRERARYNTLGIAKRFSEVPDNDFDLIAIMHLNKDAYFQSGYMPINFSNFLSTIAYKEKCKDFTLKISADERWRKENTLYYFVFEPRTDSSNVYKCRFDARNWVDFKLKRDTTAYQTYYVYDFVENVLKNFEDQTFMCFIQLRRNFAEIEIGVQTCQQDA